jgi:hypothetical protein
VDEVSFPAILGYKEKKSDLWRRVRIQGALNRLGFLVESGDVSWIFKEFYPVLMADMNYFDPWSRRVE